MVETGAMPDGWMAGWMAGWLDGWMARSRHTSAFEYVANSKRFVSPVCASSVCQPASRCSRPTCSASSADAEEALRDRGHGGACRRPRTSPSAGNNDGRRLDMTAVVCGDYWGTEKNGERRAENRELENGELHLKSNTSKARHAIALLQRAHRSRDTKAQCRSG